MTDDAPIPHRRLAVELFNRTWELMELAQRDVAADDEMVHAAHASTYHWSKAGGPIELARGEWLCSRVYAVLERPEPALHHAIRCKQICEEHGIADFDSAYAHEAIARALALRGDHIGAQKEIARAEELGNAIAEDEDRAQFFADLQTVPRAGSSYRGF